jgi:hypothetical protein
MQVTIRRVEEDWIKKAKAEAQAKGISMNEVLRRALAIGLGIGGERRRKSNLDRYAGDSDFGTEWESYLNKDLQKVDEELWS